MADLTPITRKEMYMGKAAGMSVNTPDPPITREEMFLSAIAGSIANKADLDENGLIPTSELPPVVFEHMVTVANDTARFALTTDDVQNGDTVYVDSTQKMYFVIDDTKLGSEQGYQEYVAGTAAKAVGDKNGNDITTTYQLKIDDQHKISADLVDDSNSTNKFVTTLEKQLWNHKQNAIDSSHKLSSRLVDDSTSTNKFVTETEKQTWNGKQDALTFDTTPTQHSTNPVESGGVHTALAGKLDDKTTHTTINGIDVYVSNTQPTGNIAVGSVGIGW